MKVIVPALAARQFGGAARHFEGFVHALGQYASDVQFIIYVNEDFYRAAPELRRSLAPNVRLESVATLTGPRRVYWDQAVLPRLALRQGAHAIWSILGFGPGRAPGAIKMLNFQRTPTYYCRAHLRTLSRGALALTTVRRQLQFLAMRAAHRIVTPSDAMRAMVRGVYPGLPSAKFVTIPHAFEPAPQGIASALPPAIDELLPADRGDEFRVLYVGHLLPYKNLEVLLDVLPAAQARTAKQLRAFLTIGREDWSTGFDRFVARRNDMGLEKNVSVLGKVPSAAVPELYRRCHVLAYPSLCETFGWPILEAMSFGVPIIAARTPVNEEQAGEAALFYDEDRVDVAVDHVVRLAENPADRRQLSERGLQRVERIRVPWDAYVRRCLEQTLAA